MISICVYSEKYVEIENKVYEIQSLDEMIIFIKDLLDKAHYAGEKLCLEKVTFDNDKGQNDFEEIDRW